MKYCDICFKEIVSPEDHADWCPKKPDYGVEKLKDLFGINNKEDKEWE